MSNDVNEWPNNQSPEIVKQFALFGVATFWLATALETTNYESAWQLFHGADFLGTAFSAHPVFDLRAYSMLSHAAKVYIAHKYDENEYHYQDLFRKFASVIIPNCELIHKGNMGSHVPDAWISINGDDIPVEVKFREFDQKAMKQLKRYMSVYDCEYGVAVGRTTDIEPWPENVLWVSTSTLDELEKQTPEHKKCVLECAEREKRNLEAIKAFFKEMLSPDALAIFERTLNKNSSAESTG